MRDLKEITEMPTVIDNTHESVYRCYHVLNHVKIMLERGDSVETIMEIINILENR